MARKSYIMTTNEIKGLIYAIFAFIPMFVIFLSHINGTEMSPHKEIEGYIMWAVFMICAELNLQWGKKKG